MLNRSMPLLMVLIFLFGSACTGPSSKAVRPARDREITIAFVGDVLLHQRLRSREEKTREGYRGIWSDIAPYLERPHLSYANLEGPVAPDLGGVSGYPRFNFPVKIISDLKDSGFDVVSTANNHALDRGAAGLEKTIQNLRQHGLAHTGTVAQSAEDWWAVLPAAETQIAFLACTEYLNGHHDRKQQVLSCFRDRDRIRALIRELAVKARVGAVIVLPHWGEENVLTVTGAQRAWARDMIDAGATAVVGAHPHVVQPVELYTSADGRAGVICYSLGNFISNQSAVMNRLSMIFYLRLKGKDGERMAVSDSRALPLWIERRIEPDGTAKYRLDAVWDFRLIPPPAKAIWTGAVPAERNFRDRAELEMFLGNQER